MSAIAENGGLRPQQEPLGTLLLERGLITPEQLTVALAEQKTSGQPLGAVVVAHGFAAPASIAQALATQHGGVLKTEYGYATGFGAGLQPPEDVAAPPVSAPRITKTSSESAVPTLRMEPPRVEPPVHSEIEQRLEQRLTELTERVAALEAAGGNRVGNR